MQPWPLLEGDPRAVLAPTVFEALRRAVTSVRVAAPSSELELVRLRVAMLLDDAAESAAPAWGEVTEAQRGQLADWPTSDAFSAADRAALALAEQFTIDVTGVAAGPLGAAAGAFGASTLPLVQGVFLIDLGQRCAKVLGALFGGTVTSAEWAAPIDGAPADPMEAISALLRATARLQNLDPVLRELVRMRGAHHHRCRRCQSVRSVAAIEAGADEDLLARTIPGAEKGLDPQARAALALTDALLVGRADLDADLIAEVHRRFVDADAVELICYVMRNSANKIAVAFGADAAIVDEGFEYQMIDAEGETITVAAPPPRGR
ncbi:MAG: carboxymuconolactone decarboxylase family protein [Acidobacteria bacterium]|nr:carboxymuconolactone decarboxylase family protein [Acidobacteriota bacterium]